MAERQQSTSGFIQAQRLAQADHFTAGSRATRDRPTGSRRIVGNSTWRALGPRGGASLFNEKQITWHTTPATGSRRRCAASTF